MTPFVLGGILTWLAFVFGAGFAHARYKRQVNEEASLNISKAFDGQKEDAKLILHLLSSMQKRMEMSEQNARLAIPKEATRVYAVLLQRGIETRILIQAASTLAEMQDICARELGAGWMAVITAYTDVLPVNPSEPKVALVEKPVAKFIYDLEYSRDKLAESPTEKAAMESIITRIKKQHYGHSRSGSAA